MARYKKLSPIVIFLLVVVTACGGCGKNIFIGLSSPAEPDLFAAVDINKFDTESYQDALGMAKFFGLDVSLPDTKTGDIMEGFTIEDFLRLKSYRYQTPVTDIYENMVLNRDTLLFAIPRVAQLSLGNYLETQGITDYKMYTIPELIFSVTDKVCAFIYGDSPRVFRGTVYATADGENKLGLKPGVPTVFDIEMRFAVEPGKIKTQSFSLLGFVESSSEMPEILNKYYRYKEGKDASEKNHLSAVIIEEPRITVPDDYLTIQEAIDASKDGGTIMVKPGEYVENITIENKNITLRGQNPYDKEIIETTVIDGNLKKTTISIVNCNPTIAGFTIQGGSGTPLCLDRLLDYFSLYDGLYGGGIIMRNSSPLIANNIIQNNNVTRERYNNGNGGGIAVLEKSTPLIINNIIENNQADKGGGIYVIDDTLGCSYFSISMIGSRTEGYVFDDSITNSSKEDEEELRNPNSIIKFNAIKNNIANYGGGIHADKSTSQIIGNDISNNKALRDGGGLSLGDDRAIVPLGVPFANITKVYNNHIDENHAKMGGGAIAIYEGSFLSLGYNTIRENKAQYGGVIYSGKIYRLPIPFEGAGESTNLIITKNDFEANNSVDGKDIAAEVEAFFIILDDMGLTISSDFLP